MAQLADILVSLTLDTSKFKQQLDAVGQELNNFKNRVKQTTSDLNGDFGKNMVEMAKGLKMVNKSTAITSQSMTQKFNAITGEMEDVIHSSKKLARELSTSYTDMAKVFDSAQKEFEEFGSASTRISMDVAENFKYLPKHLQRYVQRLQEAGTATTEFGELNEMWGKRNVENLIRTNDFLQNKTKVSTGLIKALKDQDIQPLSRQFLKLGERLEDNAKKGSALNLALTQLGKNAGPKELNDRIKLIKTGIQRATITMIGMGIVTGLSIWGLIEMSNVVDGRLIPAFDELKSVWLDALTPFVKAFTDFVLFLMDGAIAVGNLMKTFAEAHPVLSNMFWGFILITMALMTLLAPLAVGIGLAGGLSAGFALLWTTIAPFVLGFLTVAGVAVLIAAALVIVIGVIHMLWKNSEAFRDAWIGVWEGVKAAFMNSFATPIAEAWERLKLAFMDLIHIFTGGEAHSIGEFWGWLGDILAIAINAIANEVLPVLNAAFKLFGQIVVAVIDGVILVIQWLAEQWKIHGDSITAVLLIIWAKVVEAFTSIKSFVVGIMPSLLSLISTTFDLIMLAIDFVMKYIAPVVVAAFKIIWAIIKFVMPWILNIIVSVWNNIKNVITSTIGIIQGVIKLFSSILKGDWKGAWEAVKSILKNGVILIWNLIQLYFIGKMLKVLSGFGSAAKSLTKTAWTGIWNAIKSVLSTLKNGVVNVWRALTSSLKGSFTGIKNLAVNTFNFMKNSVVGIFNGIKNSATTIFNKVKNAITKPIETAKNTVLGIIDKIKAAFAGMAITIPKPKMPKLSIGKTSKTIMGKEFSVPTFDVSWNAKGGIFNGASILGGGQGVGEAGAEAVLPIQHKRYMRPFAHAVGSYLEDKSPTQQSTGGDKYEINFNQPVVIREDADIQRVVDELERRKKMVQRSKGVFSY